MGLRLKIIAGLAILVVLGLAFVLFWQSALLDIDEFEVVGSPNTAAEDVIAISGLKKGDQLLNLNLGKTAESVRRLPWVKSVDIDRSWGGKIKFNIVEREMIAVAFSPYGYVLLDAEGHILELLGAETDCLGYAQQSPDLLCIANLIAPSIPGSVLPERNRPIAELVALLSTTQAVDTATNEVITMAGITRQIVVNTAAREVSLELTQGGWILLGDPAEMIQNKLNGAINLLASGQLESIGQQLCGDAILDVSTESRASFTPGTRC